MGLWITTFLVFWTAQKQSTKPYRKPGSFKMGQKLLLHQS
nr:MAG TPA: hypothetical protein [Caudoviricetes sp.]